MCFFVLTTRFGFREVVCFASWYSVTQMGSEHPKNLKKSRVKWYELHVNCSQRGGKGFGENMENYLAGLFNH